MVKIPVYKIDKDIPIPQEPETLHDNFPLEVLEVGESFEFPDEFRRYVASKASTIKRRKGMEFTVRKVDDVSCRVWRIA